MLEVWVDGDLCAPCWNQQSHGELRLPMTAGEHECCVRRTNGETSWDCRVVVEDDIFARMDAGVLFEKAASDPQGRSQFSFDRGQSACSFLAVNAAAMLWDKLAVGGDDIEIQGAEITGEHVAEVLSWGMSRYVHGCVRTRVCVYLCMHVCMCECMLHLQR